MFLQFIVLFYFFPFIYVQIQGYEEIILMLHVGKHIEEIISYKCVNFDAISLIALFIALQINSESANLTCSNVHDQLQHFGVESTETV